MEPEPSRFHVREDTSLERAGGIQPGGVAFQYLARHPQDVGALQTLQRHMARPHDRLPEQQRRRGAALGTTIRASESFDIELYYLEPMLFIPVSRKRG